MPWFILIFIEPSRSLHCIFQHSPSIVMKTGMLHALQQPQPHPRYAACRPSREGRSRAVAVAVGKRRCRAAAGQGGAGTPPQVGARGTHYKEAETTAAHTAIHVRERRRPSTSQIWGGSDGGGHPCRRSWEGRGGDAPSPLRERWGWAATGRGWRVGAGARGCASSGAVRPLPAGAGRRSRPHLVASAIRRSKTHHRQRRPFTAGGGGVQGGWRRRSAGTRRGPRAQPDARAKGRGRRLTPGRRRLLRWRGRAHQAPCSTPAPPPRSERERDEGKERGGVRGLI